MALVIFSMGFAGMASAQANLAAGCSSTVGYSTTSGVACNGSTTIPVGCTSVAGFSTTTGTPCNGLSYYANGGTQFPNGCNSTAGFSTVTGAPCNGASGVGPNGVTYYIAGCNSAFGYSAISGLACNTIMGTMPQVAGSGTTTPGLPTTGEGAQALFTAMMLVLSAGLVAYGVSKLVRAPQR